MLCATLLLAVTSCMAQELNKEMSGDCNACGDGKTTWTGSRQYLQRKRKYEFVSKFHG